MMNQGGTESRENSLFERIFPRGFSREVSLRDTSREKYLPSVVVGARLEISGVNSTNPRASACLTRVNRARKLIRVRICAKNVTDFRARAKNSRSAADRESTYIGRFLRKTGLLKLKLNLI